MTDQSEAAQEKADIQKADPLWFDWDEVEKAERAAIPVAQDEELSALCLSGGGIRSASFALGVMQGLADAGVLGKFHYLSTVSGGGYIGGWLSSWRARAKNDMEVFSELNKRGDYGREKPELRHLRWYSNFLTPKAGFMSADTWAAIAIYLRNLFLNWLIYLPLFASILMVPAIIYEFADFIYTEHEYFQQNWPNWAYAAVGLMLFALVRSLAARSLPDKKGFILDYVDALKSSVRDWAHPYYAKLRGEKDQKGPNQQSEQNKKTPAYGISIPTSQFRWTVLVFYWLAAVVIVILALLSSADQSKFDSFTDFETFKVVGLGGVLLYAVAWLLAALWRWTERPFFVNFFPFVVWSISGAVFTVLVVTGIGIAHEFGGDDCQQCGVNILFGLEVEKTPAMMMAVIFGVPWIMLSIQLAETIYVGFSSFSRDLDLEREWLARSSGYLSLVSFAWIILSFIALVGPDLVAPLNEWVAGLLGLGAASGTAAVVGGKSGATAATAVKNAVKKLSPEQILPLAALVFLIVLGIFLAYGVRVLIASDDARHLFDFARPTMENASAYILPVTSSHKDTVPEFLELLVGAGILFGVSAFVSLAVNINRFSMHNLYRNRLVRAFLGAARGQRRPDEQPTPPRPVRQPDKFTDFDLADNIMMADIWPKPTDDKAWGRKLFHVVNVALNTVGNDDLALQERKAENFVITPLHAGNVKVGFRPTSPQTYPDNEKRLYGGSDGISLGTAITISGAAASPNMGYHSSPLVSIVMMLFNVRLGWWLGNPFHETSWTKVGPQFSITRIFQEMLGKTNNRSKYAYLSDGGHFENMGLYEMVRRRCKFIVVSDASCDPTCTHADFGMTLRKIRIDLGANITFDPFRIQLINGKGDKYCAVGRIKYATGDDEGRILYIKPALCGGEPVDVVGYANAHEGFPHESTADQWFSESQMESYRALGKHTVLRFVSPVQSPTLDALFDAAKNYVEDKKSIREDSKPPTQPEQH